MTEHFDVVVIGSGPGGYVAAIRAAQLGMKTACVEKQKELGGTCLNVGCIPSKALLYSSELYWKIQHESKLHGIEITDSRLNFGKMMQRKEQIIATFNQGIKSLFQKNKITHLNGKACLLNSQTVQIEGDSEKQISANAIILATGSEPISLPFLPFDERKILSSTGALSLPNVPKKLLVVGAGIIGVELGSVYARLGAEVVFIEFMDRVCPTLDASLCKELKRLLEQQGMRFFLSSKVTGAQISDTVSLQVLLSDQTTQEMHADATLVCIGRKPYTQGLGLEKVGIATTDKGFVKINGSFRTNISSIFAIGDIVDGPMLAHKASEEGVAVAEILAGHSPTIEYAAIPSVVYTEPEVASVGLSEEDAKKYGLDFRIGTFYFKANSRAQCTGETHGFVKMLAESKTDTLLGVHIIGAHASELIAEAAVCLQKRCTCQEIATTPHAHPTLSEALKEAALATKKMAIHQ